MSIGRTLRATALAMLLATAASPAVAQVNDPRFRNYFLVGEFGEVCTMCEVAVVCTAGDAPPAADAVPATGDFTLYMLHTRTFWSQVYTIWEWFIANFTSRSLAAGHERPVTIHSVAGGNWPAPAERTMRISLEPPLLAFGDGTEVDRVDRRWRKTGGGEPLGYCARLPLWDTLDVIAAKSPAGAPR